MNGSFGFLIACVLQRASSLEARASNMPFKVNPSLLRVRSMSDGTGDTGAVESVINHC